MVEDTDSPLNRMKDTGPSTLPPPISLPVDASRIEWRRGERLQSSASVFHTLPTFSSFGQQSLSSFTEREESEDTFSTSTLGRASTVRGGGSGGATGGSRAIATNRVRSSTRYSTTSPTPCQGRKTARAGMNTSRRRSHPSFIPSPILCESKRERLCAPLSLSSERKTDGRGDEGFSRPSVVVLKEEEEGGEGKWGVRGGLEEGGSGNFISLRKERRGGGGVGGGGWRTNSFPSSSRSASTTPSNTPSRLSKTGGENPSFGPYYHHHHHRILSRAFSSSSTSSPSGATTSYSYPSFSSSSGCVNRAPPLEFFSSSKTQRAPQGIRVIYREMVYLVPMAFILQDHPGGMEAILQHQGQDISFFFSDHSPAAQQRMKMWKIGPVSLFADAEAQEREKTTTPPSSPSSSSTTTPVSLSPSSRTNRHHRCPPSSPPPSTTISPSSFFSLPRVTTLILTTALCFFSFFVASRSSTAWRRA